MQQIHLTIQGMSCGHCVAAVRQALSELPGVTVQDVQIGKALVQVDPAQASTAALIDAVQDAGYEASEAA